MLFLEQCIIWTAFVRTTRQLIDSPIRSVKAIDGEHIQVGANIRRLKSRH
jgi:hypothetical protein